MIRTLLCLGLATSVLACATQRRQVTAAAVTGGLSTLASVGLLYAASLQPSCGHMPFNAELDCELERTMGYGAGTVLLIGGLISLGVAVVHSQYEPDRATGSR